MGTSPPWPTVSGVSLQLQPAWPAAPSTSKVIKTRYRIVKKRRLTSPLSTAPGPRSPVLADGGSPYPGKRPAPSGLQRPGWAGRSLGA